VLGTSSKQWPSWATDGAVGAEQQQQRQQQPAATAPALGRRSSMCMGFLHRGSPQTLGLESYVVAHLELVDWGSDCHNLGRVVCVCVWMVSPLNVAVNT
jgi:hypothetical protein